MNVTEESVAVLTAGLQGMLFRPTGVDPYSGVIVIGGSEGGSHDGDARLLAEEGLLAVSLAYFGVPGLPNSLKDIPLETFFRAIDLLEAQGIATGSIGILGGSRGGEAALLTASHDRRVGAVVSVVGSGIVTQGIDYDAGSLPRILASPATPWTLDSQPLSYLPYQVPPDLTERIARQEPVRLREMYASLPRDSDQLATITIPVERIAGAVLLLSAEDDQMWDSSGYSQVAADRLSSHDHRWPWEHVVYPGAGHGIAGPPRGQQTSSLSPGPGVTFEMGGTPAMTTSAQADAWSRTVAFLRGNL
jgi:dienelactone hydrolase